VPKVVIGRFKMPEIIDYTGNKDDVLFFKSIEFDGFKKKSGSMIDKIVDCGGKHVMNAVRSQLNWSQGGNCGKN
jgi:hypothetical protein